MKRPLVYLGLVMFLLVVAVTPSALHAECVETVNDCTDQNLTDSYIQIGGPGSQSSNEECGGFTECNDPGRLDQGTIAEAWMEFSLDRANQQLTLSIGNTTQTIASLTAIYFQTPDAVTGMQLDSVTTCAPDVCAPLTGWDVLFDPANLRADGFGRFDAYVGNSPDTGLGGGDPLECPAGETLTVVLSLTGDLSSVTACSFTSEYSKIPPGSKVVTGVGRFQAGENDGDSGWLGTCSDGDLFVDLKFFAADPADGRVVLHWETATELDNLGFNVLRKPEIGGGPWEIVNASLIPAQGDPLGGAAYSFEDANLTNGVRYRYRLEDIDLAGINMLHPVEMALANPKAPPIKLLAPAYGHSFLTDDAMQLRWESNLRGPMRVQFSADPEFPDTNRVDIPARGRRRGGTQEITLNPQERILIEAIMAGAEEGQIYWRVVQLTRGSRAPRQSDVFRLGQEE